ncbi:MAG: hypothetical protein AAF399_30240, partial [Bacteroidota bacterium]
MTSFYRLMIATLILGFLSSCASEPAATQSSPSSEPLSSTPSAPSPEEEISTLLFAYYEDIANEQLDPQRYFAPTLDQFFSSQSISREEVAKSIRSGFEQIESREIKLDPSSLEISQQGNQYVAEFSGTSLVMRTGQGRSLEEPFSNRVTFNGDLQIVGFESLASASKSRSIAPDQRTSAGPSEVYAQLIQGFRSGDMAAIAPHIHPNQGFYLMTQPGAVAVPYKLSQAEEMLSQAPWFRDGLTKLRPAPEDAPLPEFDCGDFFSKEGIRAVTFQLMAN